MDNMKFPKLGQGPAVIADDEDLKRDATGYTNPNLHRRLDPQKQDFKTTLEVAPRDYSLIIEGKNSYRTTEIHLHDDICEGDKVYYTKQRQPDGTVISVPVEIP